jgi:hypothetical protein
MDFASEQNKKRYWVVSPNVVKDEDTVAEWRKASVVGHAAFMGYGPNDREHNASGYKFAHVVEPGNVILIARRHKNEPEIVGFGVVKGSYVKGRDGMRLKGRALPDTPGSLRRLHPFRARTSAKVSIPLMSALKHTKALAELHPDKDPDQRKICDWIEQVLKRDTRIRGGKGTGGKIKNNDPRLVPLGSFQEDYVVRTRARVVKAKQVEFKLVDEYSRWLEGQDRKLSRILYGRLRCDGWEQGRQNLIEAKSSNRREHLRMAVGQLFDYEHQGEQKLGILNKAVLVPQEPGRDEIAWLKALNISVIWREKGQFLDSTNGQFT